MQPFFLSFPSFLPAENLKPEKKNPPAKSSATQAHHTLGPRLLDPNS